MSNTLVTGGSRGIGFELCRQLASRGDEVITTCRNPSKKLNSLGVRVIHNIDVSNAEDVLKLKQQLHGTGIDTLIHNAGILSRETLDNLDFGKIEMQFQVNTLGPLRVIHALLDNLHDGSKLGIVTSRMGSIGDNESGGMYGYRISKAGANMVGMTLARDLGKRNIPVAILHPGYVATEMTDGKGIAPEDAARGIIARMDTIDMNNTGVFWHAEGYELPW